MKLNEIKEELDSSNDEISEKAAEIQKCIKKAISYIEYIEGDDFIDGSNPSFDSAKSELENAEYAVDELIDDLL